MQKFSIVALLLLLAGCTTTGNGNLNTSNNIYPVLFDKPYGTSEPQSKPQVVYTDQNEKPLTTRDIKAINEAIAAQKVHDWAPQEEVLQESMSDEIHVSGLNPTHKIYSSSED